MTRRSHPEEPTTYVSIDQELRAGIAREQTLADLPNRGVATLHAIHRRRHQIALVAGLVATAVILATLVSEKVIDIGADSWIDADVARYGLVAFGLGIVLYAFDKDRHLRRVVAQRERIYELDCEIAGSLLSAGLVLDAVTAVHTELALDRLLPTIVDQGRTLIGADKGVLFIEEPGRPMEPVIDVDGLAPVAKPMVELVGERRAVVGVVEGSTIDIGVPILCGTELLAVLVLPGVVANALTPDTTALLERFGVAAGTALVNARRYEAAMFLLDVA
jgi:hypothetical protein